MNPQPKKILTYISNGLFLVWLGYVFYGLAIEWKQHPEYSAVQFFGGIAKSLIPFSIAILVVIGGVYLFFRNDKSTDPSDLRLFRVFGFIIVIVSIWATFLYFKQ